MNVCYLGEKMQRSKELKELLGNRARDIILSGTNRQADKSGKINCLVHSPDNNPSMSWHSVSYKFHCFSCGADFDIYNYYQDVHGMSFVEAVEEVKKLVGGVELDLKRQGEKIETKPVYKQPDISLSELNQEAIDLMKDRGISEQTLKDWDVLQGEWSYGGKYKSVYVYQYFDENGERPFVSFRTIEKNPIKGGRVPGTKPILWGMQHVIYGDPVVIVEGQIDAMTIYQAGYRHVVSIPSGAQDHSWIKNCWEWIQDKEFIIWADNDDQGRKCADTIKKSLGESAKIIMHHKYKDANEFYNAEGPEAVIKFIDEAINETPEGIINMGRRKSASCEQEIIETGFYDLDRHFHGLRTGELTILFGRDNEGKSTIISQVIAHELRNSKVFLYSGELIDETIENWIMRQIMGHPTGKMDMRKDKWGNKIFTVKPEIKEKIRNWYKDKFFVYESSLNLKKDDALISTMELAYKKYGVRFFVIDNLMTAIEEEQTELNSQQSNFAKKCKNFAIAYNVHVMVVCHPNKYKGEGEPLDKKDVSGTKNITNIADNVVAVERVWDNVVSSDPSYGKMDESRNEKYSLILRALKDRVGAGREIFHYHFNFETNRFWNDETPVFCDYGWDK